MKKKLAPAAVAAVLAAAVLAVAPPTSAQASTDVYGYVWANQPSTGNYLANTGYEFNSTGGDIEIIRQQTGRYQVRFAAMGSSGGVVHAQAYGLTSNFCTVANWHHGIDLAVNVRCFDPAGAPADSRFVAHFTNRPVATGHLSQSSWGVAQLAYLWADRPTTTGPYQPAPAYAYDSTGISSEIQRVGTGSYLVYLGAYATLYPGLMNSGHLQVTAYNNAAVHCGLRLAGDEYSAPLGVRCHDSHGNPIDSRFTVSYSHRVSPLGTTGYRGNAYIRNSFHNPPTVSAWFSSSGTVPVVSHGGTGIYSVRFPGLGTPHGHAIVNTQEMALGHYCNAVSWSQQLSDLVVNVRCYDGVTHAPTDYDFGVSFHTLTALPPIVIPPALSGR